MNIKFSALLFCLFSVFTAAVGQDTSKVSTPFHKFLTERGVTAEASKLGYCYRIESQGKGVKPKAGDYVQVQYRAFHTDSVQFDQTVDTFVFQVGYHQVLEGLDLGVKEFAVGSKGSLYVPPSLGFGAIPVGDVPGNAILRYDLTVCGILDARGYDRYMRLVEEREKKAFESRMEEQFLTDKKLINDYVLTKKLKTKRTDSGLSYALIKEGKGPLVNVGDTVTVHYEGFLLNSDKPFESSFGGAPLSFRVGGKAVIAGWDEGIRFFNAGAEGWLVVPSKLGYGPAPLTIQGGELPGNSALAFRIKVLSIKPASKS